MIERQEEMSVNEGPMAPRERIRFAEEEYTENAKLTAMGQPRFRVRLKRAAEDGVLLAVKYGIVLALWLGTGYLAWTKVATISQQAFNGQLSYQWLVANAQKLETLMGVKPQIPAATPSPSPEDRKAFR